MKNSKYQWYFLPHSRMSTFWHFRDNFQKNVHEETSGDAPPDDVRPDTVPFDRHDRPTHCAIHLLSIEYCTALYPVVN